MAVYYSYTAGVHVLWDRHGCNYEDVNLCNSLSGTLRYVLRITYLFLPGEISHLEKMDREKVASQVRLYCSCGWNMPGGELDERRYFIL